MKTYEEARAELFEWIWGQFEKILDLPAYKGREIERSEAIKMVQQEWVHRNSELESFYNVSIINSFEDEKSELVAWCKNAYQEAEVRFSQLSKCGGYDDRLTHFTHPVSMEWNRRLRYLKKKYGKSED